MKALNADAIAVMRAWVLETAERLSQIGGTLTAEQVNAFTDEEIVAGVQKFYRGGIEQFLAEVELYGEPIQ